MKILVVDDDLELLGLIGFALRQAGYLVIEASDGRAALATFAREQPDLVILDVNLPELSGFEVCRQIRAEAATPVMLLTVRSSEEDQVRGLDGGADDYLTKPFSPRELVARARVILRRAAGGDPVELVRAGGLTLDRSRYQADLNGHAMDLTPTEFEILATLAAQPGRIFSRDQLLNAAHGLSFDGYERAIDWHIRNLRRKLEADEVAHIVTVHGVGYKYVV